MNRSVAGLSVHPLSEKPLVLHLLSHESPRNADLLSPDNDLQIYDMLPILTATLPL